MCSGVVRTPCSSPCAENGPKNRRGEEESRRTGTEHHREKRIKRKHVHAEESGKRSTVKLPSSEREAERKRGAAAKESESVSSAWTVAYNPRREKETACHSVCTCVEEGEREREREREREFVARNARIERGSNEGQRREEN